MWNKNNRLHTINKKHVYKERKEITHGEMGEITYKWNNVSKIERKEKDI